MASIDLNADVGEYSSAGVDANIVEQQLRRDTALMPYISSANIACGAHAGDIITMRETVRIAGEHNVAIGAHPGFADRENFGRRSMQLSPDEIYQLVTSQLSQLQQVVHDEGRIITHVKPHGALYNMSAQQEDMSTAILRACADITPNVLIVGLSGSRFLQVAADQGFSVRAEAFADRRYQADGSLAPRELPNAVISSPPEAAGQALAIALGQSITTITGEQIRLRAETICLHGDSDNAASAAMQLNRLLASNGVSIGLT